MPTLSFVPRLCFVPNMADKMRLCLSNIIRVNRRRRLLMHTAVGNLLARRRLLLCVCSVVVLLLTAAAQRNAITRVPRLRSCRRLIRNAGWWNKVWTTYSDVRFKKTFRVSRGTFLFILSRIRHVLQKQTVTEEPISPEERLGICLYRLGRGDYYYTISEMVARGVSTVNTIVQEVSQVLVEYLWGETISSNMPKCRDDFEKKIIDMEELWQFPCCWAALDGCHIPMKCPPGGLVACKEYHNFKNFYSIVLMALVDSQYRFIWGSCGFPGNSHDAIIFQSTNLWNSIQDGLLPSVGKVVGEENVPPLILGDSAFPLRTWLMKPYTNAVLSPQQRYFNYRLSRARMVTEGAYGQLKGRWRVLLRKNESNKGTVRITALACMVLHNVCIMQGDSISRKLDLTFNPNGKERRNREEVRRLLKMRECRSMQDVPGAATRIRNALCEKLQAEKETGIVS